MTASQHSPQIQEMSLSLIWTETLLDLLQQPVPQTPFAFLSSDITFEDEFERAAQSLQPNGLTLPWRSSLLKQFFWKYYLELNTKGVINGKKAWKFNVPLRKKLYPKIKALWPQGRFGLEAFYYPHGLALVATLGWSGQFTLDEAVTQVFQNRELIRYEVPAAGGAAEQLSLDDLVVKWLNDNRAESHGPEVESQGGARPPFTVWTVIRGDGVNIGAPIQQGGAIQRALEALTTWDEIGPNSNLPSLNFVTIGINKQDPKSHVLYGRTRGRAIWFPETFMDRTDDLHKLGCYHRNMVLMSMQVESLSGLVAITAQQIRNQGVAQVPATQQVVARRAAGALSRLYGGKPHTYQSRSPERQIKENGFFEDISEVRKHLMSAGTDPLV